MENRRFAFSEVTEFVRFIKEACKNDRKILENDYLPLQKNEVYYIGSNLRKIHLRSV